MNSRRAEVASTVKQVFHRECARVYDGKNNVQGFFDIRFILHFLTTIWASNRKTQAGKSFTHNCYTLIHETTCYQFYFDQYLYTLINGNIFVLFNPTITFNCSKYDHRHTPHSWDKTYFLPLGEL